MPRRYSGVRHFASLDAIKTALASSPVRFVLPAHLPDGYVFYEGTLTYACAASYSYTLLETETTADGLVIERYQTAPEADVISGYSMLYKNAAGDMLRFGADLANSGDDVGFGCNGRRRIHGAHHRQYGGCRLRGKTDRYQSIHAAIPAQSDCLSRYVYDDAGIRQRREHQPV